MSELRDRLREVEAPDAGAAERRAWELATAAYDERPPRARRAPVKRIALAAALLAAVVATAATPAGEAVGDWMSDIVRPGRKDARPAIGRLPAPGQVLVSSPAGAWVVQRDGSARRLGAYDDARWSPRGLFVVATRGRRLVALEPDGTVRWVVSRPLPVRLPAWSAGDGFRIAYLSGGALRVVGGDGVGDRLVDRHARAVRPAWRPGPGYVVAYVRSGGRIALADAENGRRLLRSPPGLKPKALEWTADGRQLVAMARGKVWVLNPALRLRGGIPVPTGMRAESMKVHPDGRSVALVRRAPRGRSDIVSFPLRGPGGRRLLFAGQGRFTDLAWSPDGRWLLVSWREADQWLLIRSSRVRRVVAVAGIRDHFDPGGSGAGSFPRLGGWCCAPAAAP